MLSDEKIALVREHIRLENAHELDAVMETFGSSARYDDEPWDEHHTGRAAVRSFYEGLLGALPDSRSWSAPSTRAKTRSSSSA